MNNKWLKNIKNLILLSIVLIFLLFIFVAIKYWKTKSLVFYLLQIACFLSMLLLISFYKKHSDSYEYNKKVENMVQDRTKEMKKEKDKFVDELEYARIIQQSLLPLRELTFDDISFSSAYFPCERLSGDFYDIYRIDENSIGMYVLDVSGHGISAALMTMFCNNFIKSPERIVKKYRGLKPHRNLSNFYEEFNKVNFPPEMYMVMMYASYNIKTRVLTYCSGGLNSEPIVIRKNGGIEYLDQSSGFPICRMEDVFVPEYESARIQLYKGDRVIFYTDGLVDDMHNGVLGLDDLKAILNMCRDEELTILNQQIQSQIIPIADTLSDDITYFIMEA